jgi:hypothetical protein
MTEREWRLRKRIDALTDERDRLRRLKAPKSLKGVATRHCVYCGARTRTSRLVAACPCHRDLVAVDSHYTVAA